jgi:hypothetical protein
MLPRAVVKRVQPHDLFGERHEIDRTFVAFARLLDERPRRTIAGARPDDLLTEGDEFAL